MTVKEKLTVYHGSSETVDKPDLEHSRVDIDFGVGFYLTEDEKMAKKWASSKNNSVVNKYELSLSGLKVYEFSLDKEWLDYVKSNRMMSEKGKFKDYDVLIGATADDKLFDTIREYLDETMNAEETIETLNVLGYSQQIVIKSEKALENIQFISSKELHSLEKQSYRNLLVSDRKIASAKTLELKKKFAYIREKALQRYKEEMSKQVISEDDKEKNNIVKI